MTLINPNKPSTIAFSGAVHTADDNINQTGKSADTTSALDQINPKNKSREELKEQIGSSKRSKINGSPLNVAVAKSEILSTDHFLEAINPDLTSLLELKNNAEHCRSAAQHSVMQELIEDMPAVKDKFLFHANQATTFEPSPSAEHSIYLDARHAITLQSPQMELQFSRIIKKADLLPQEVRINVLAEIKNIFDENVDEVIQDECAKLCGEDKYELNAQYVMQANVPAVFQGLLETSVLLPTSIRVALLEKMEKSMYQYPFVIFSRVAFAHSFECSMSEQNIQNRRAAYMQD